MKVTAEDGVELHVEVDGDPNAAITCVLIHGFTANLEEWVLQREALASQARVVLYDHRGHGRSGWNGASAAHISQLARDLHAVIEAAAPTGPVVLVGHSMGGMTLLSFARQYPELIGTRIVGAFLLATSSGHLDKSALGRVLSRVPSQLLTSRPGQLMFTVLGPLDRPGTLLGRLRTRRLLFGRNDADGALVHEVQTMLERTPWDIRAAFLPTLMSHDEHAGTKPLSKISTTVLVGTHDRLTPVEHTAHLAQQLGRRCRTVLVPGAGHSVNVTWSELVNDEIVSLVKRASKRR